MLDKVAAFDGDSTIIKTLPFAGECAIGFVLVVDFFFVDVAFFVLVAFVVADFLVETGIVITPRKIF